jgi:hypothetical protein
VIYCKGIIFLWGFFSHVEGRLDWIQTQSAVVASRRANPLATHRSSLQTFPLNLLDQILQNTLCINHPVIRTKIWEHLHIIHCFGKKYFLIYPLDIANSTPLDHVKVAQA